MIKLDQARGKLALIWFPGIVILFTLLFISSFWFGSWGDHPGAVIKWFTTQTVPTASMIITMYLAKTNASELESSEVSRSIFSVTAGISIFYFVLLCAVLIFAVYARTPSEAMVLLENALYLTTPMQGLVAAALSIFFLNVAKHD